MKYLPWKDRKAVAADLTPIYQAATLADSEAVPEAFSASGTRLIQPSLKSGFGIGRTLSRYSTA